MKVQSFGIQFLYFWIFYGIKCISVRFFFHNDNDDDESPEDDLFADFDQRSKKLNQQWNAFSFDDKEIYKKMARADEALYREVVSLFCNLLEISRVLISILF